MRRGGPRQQRVRGACRAAEGRQRGGVAGRQIAPFIEQATLEVKGQIVRLEEFPIGQQPCLLLMDDPPAQLQPLVRHPLQIGGRLGMSDQRIDAFRHR